jgi:hypothetical protein
MNYRSGSTVLQKLLSDRKKDEFGFLPTYPQKQCLTVVVPNARIPKTIIELENTENFVIFTYIGNWWGNRSSSDVPEPYEDHSSMKWGINEIQNLHFDGWKFAYLIRDGRNYIESHRRLRGGVEEQFNNDNPKDYFIALCKGWRNRARVALDCANKFENYNIYKFEDLLKNPLGFVRNVNLYFNDYKTDVRSIRKLTRQIKNNQIGKKHSSFNNTENMHFRWRDWTKKEINLFKEITGKEMIELGYEEDYDWKKR